ncbi:MAG: cellulase family glycosylhydrolase [Clostridiales bacterium]|nr:cellulase family glycosylhydrolase [Clostridiales bacterium]
MRKKFIVLAVIMALTMVFSLVGCGSSDTEGASASGGTDAEVSAAETEELSAEPEEDYEDIEDEEVEAELFEDFDLATPSVNGALHVDGTQLVDENGDPVQLRGISSHGLAWFPEYINSDCMADLHAWGANVFRLAMYTAESGGYCTDGDQEALKELVKEGVEYATDEDMYVIVDWHILSEGTPTTYQSEAEEFFDEMSAEFADHNNVLYEICNEPNGSADWDTIKAYAEDIIPIIRANSPNAVIIVGTPTWSQEVDKAAADPITDYDNIMYTLHFYAATHKDDLRNKMEAAINDGLPIFVTEFGICDASGNGTIDEESADAWVELMDKYNVSYVMWNLSNKDESSSIIDSSVTKTFGFTVDDLSHSGRWIYSLLQSEMSGQPYELPEMEEETEDDSAYAAEASNGMTVTKSLTNSWEDNGTQVYMYDITVTNSSGAAVTSWTVNIDFDSDVTISDGWNCTYSVSGKTLTLSSVDYNGALDDGESAEGIGVIVSY